MNFAAIVTLGPLLKSCVGICRWVIGGLAALALCIGARAQVSTYGDDRNDSPLYVAGDPPPSPKTGSIITLEWYLDGLWAEEVHSILFFGFDWSQEANVCFHSPDVDHLRNRWLLMPPLFPVGFVIWDPWTGAPFRYNLRIPDDYALVGQAIRVQAFMRATEQHGGSPCDRFRATTALRIQFMFR